MGNKEEHILKGCKAGDHKAFEELYKTWYRVLLGVAMRYARNRQEAEDILQDAFIKVFHSIGSYRGEGSFEGWLKRVVRNTAINHYRSRIKFDLYIDFAGQEESLNDGSDTKDVISLLNKLPEGYRMVINLYFIDGCTHKEIAELLNISTGTSKSQLFKAKQYLKELLENDYLKNII
jgi:RNA polymerase sigma factor (sigma-70 family)